MTARAAGPTPLCRFYDIICVLTVVIVLLGLVGNGAVIWLLGFRVRRNPFSVYILNLACADFLFLLSKSILLTVIISSHHLEVVKSFLEAVKLSSFLAGVCLLMAVSTQRCISVLWPIWYRSHRPVHLSSMVCALVWGLAFCSGTLGSVCSLFASSLCYGMHLFYYVMSLLTSLVLCVSSLMLLLRVQCCFWMRRPGRLYLTILLSVLAFLLLGLPLDTTLVANLRRNSRPDYDILLPVVYVLSVLNSAVNPVIYFFVGRYRQLRGRKSLQEVLQSALTDDDEEGSRQRAGLGPGRETAST